MQTVVFQFFLGFFLTNSIKGFEKCSQKLQRTIKNIMSHEQKLLELPRGVKIT